MNDSEYQDTEVIQRVLHTARTVAVVGLSGNHLRASNFVGFYLQRHGYRVVPVNPREAEILGEPSYPSLTAAAEALEAEGARIDIVNVFRDPSAVPDIAREAVAVGAGCLWLQFGVISPEGAEIAVSGGVEVVMDKCLKVEHARYMGRMHWLGFNTEVVSAQRRTS